MKRLLFVVVLCATMCSCGGDNKKAKEAMQNVGAALDEAADKAEVYYDKAAEATVKAYNKAADATSKAYDKAVEEVESWDWWRE